MRLPSCASLLGAVAALLTGGMLGVVPAVAAVDYRAPAASIHLDVLGSYRGGTFSTKVVQSPPAYDPDSRRLFVGSAIRRRIEVLDLSDPQHPQLAFTIGLGTEPAALAMARRVLAVAIAGPGKAARGFVVFFDEDGDPEAAPVEVGVQPSMLAFTPDGRRIVVTNTGEASEDYQLDPEGSVSIIRLKKTFLGLRADVNQVHFRAHEPRLQELRQQGIRIYGPNSSVARDLEPESVAISPDGRTAWVTLQRNNAIAAVDISSAQVMSLHPLGYKAYWAPGVQLDASDADGRINIRNWPLRAFYQPDMLAAYAPAGSVLLVMANEGDPRDFSGYTEVARVRDLQLDPRRFPNRAFLQQDRNLGRLEVTTVDGDVDGDGDYDALYAFGGRSFSIRDAQGRLVYDSGGDFERIIAAAVPRCFNCTDDANAFDATSDARGPEPEAMTLGVVGGRTYAFIAFERIGGVMVYDITDPAAPRFEQYVNNRNFAVDPARVCEKDEPQSDACARAGDLSPEGILFIAASDSPTGQPLLVLVHETSDSVTVFGITERASNTAR